MRGFIRALSRIEENDAAVRRLEAEVAALKAIPAKSKPAAKTAELDKGVNKVSFFIAIAFGLALAEGFGAVHQLGFRILTDFLSYTFGIVAAVVGSLAAYKPTRAVYYFWVSSIFIAIGFFFYLVSKGVAPLMPMAFAIGLIASLSALLVYHELSTWKTRRDIANKVSSMVTVVGGTVVVIFMCCVFWSSLEPQANIRCQINLASATSVKIYKMTPSPTANGNAGLADKESSSIILPSDSSITISPCPKELNMLTH